MTWLAGREHEEAWRAFSGAIVFDTLARWAQSRMPPADRNASASVDWAVCGDAIPDFEPRGRP